MTSTSGRFDMDAAPMRIGTVQLTVRDLGTVSDFYQRALGLSVIEHARTRVTLGAGAMALLDLEGDPALMPLDPRQAGLFHTAFLLPDRGDLARWLVHVTDASIALTGASDHTVSEALYLNDPEGNGIEVYADRPVDLWQTQTGEVEMASDPLDLHDLRKAAGGRSWDRFPEDGIVGHVHLRVGEIEAADRFYRELLGFDLTARYPGASFYGSGGYHHQLAGNVWKSRNAGPRPENMAGLGAVQILVRDRATKDAVEARVERSGTAAEHTDKGLVLRDPWGTRIVLT